MRKLFLLCIVVLLLVSCGSIKTYNEQITKKHTVEDLRADVDKLYLQLKKHHPKLYQYTPKIDMDFKFDSLKNAITNPLTTREFYKVLAPVLTYVKQGHVAVSIPGKRYTKRELKQLKKKTFEFYKLDFEYLEDKLWIKRTFGKDSTIIGAEVVKLNNEPVSKLIPLYKKRFSSDGYNKTLYNRYVGKRFLRFYVRDKGYIDSVNVAFRLKDSIFIKTFKRVAKEEKIKREDSVLAKNITPVKLSKADREAKKIAAKRKKTYNRKHGFIKRGNAYTRNFKFVGKDSSVAYMKLRSFTNGNYKKFYKESFVKIDSSKAKYFILDLRDNGGGRIAEINHLYSYLTDKDYQFITDSEVTNRVPFLKSFMANTTPTSLKVFGGVLSPIVAIHNLLKTKKKEGKLYYKFKEAKLQHPNPLNFKGHIYVLINGNSFSASSIISTHLKATNRATFVGEETGGAYNGCVAGIYKVYGLPTTKLKIRMGLMQIETPYKQSPDGYGITPDILITPNVQDRRSKQDPELKYILTSIEKQD